VLGAWKKDAGTGILGMTKTINNKYIIIKNKYINNYTNKTFKINKTK